MKSEMIPFLVSSKLKNSGDSRRNLCITKECPSFATLLSHICVGHEDVSYMSSPKLYACDPLIRTLAK